MTGRGQYILFPSEAVRTEPLAGRSSQLVTKIDRQTTQYTTDLRSSPLLMGEDPLSFFFAELVSRPLSTFPNSRVGGEWITNRSQSHGWLRSLCAGTDLSK